MRKRAVFRSGGTIWAKYANEAFDREVEAARRVHDEGQRLKHYKAA